MSENGQQGKHMMALLRLVGDDKKVKAASPLSECWSADSRLGCDVGAEYGSIL